jgi:hypothetical protein
MAESPAAEVDMVSHPSTPTPRPAYTFSFQPAIDIAPEEALVYRALVPFALAPTLIKQRGFALKYEGLPYYSDGPSCTSSQRARDLEERLYARASYRHYPQLYVMHTSAAVDESVQRVMASEAVSEAFRHLNASVESEQDEQLILNDICALSASVRRELGAAESEYGRLVPCNQQPKLDAYEVILNRDWDIIIQETRPSQQGAEDQHNWSNTSSLVLVKQTSSEDMSTAGLLRCFRYLVSRQDPSA